MYQESRQKIFAKIQTIVTREAEMEQKLKNPYFSRKNTDVLLSNMDCPGHRADSGGAAKSLALHNNADC